MPTSGNSEGDAARRQSLVHPIWAKAQRAMPRFKAGTYYAILSVPVAMASLFLLVLVHDLVAEQRSQPCWESKGKVGLLWAGSFVHWLSYNLRDGTYDCTLVPDPEAIIMPFLVLPPTWVLIVKSSSVTRRLRRDRGVVRDLLEKVYEALDEDELASQGRLSGYLAKVPRNDQTRSFLRALESDGQSTKHNHIYAAFAFQVVMLTFDFAMGSTLRWVLWYQLLWFSFSTTIVQVRPLVKFCTFLSRTLVDLYLELLRERQHSWLQLLEWHRELELDILELWGKVNLHAVMPSVPFVSLALIHLLVDEDAVSGTVVASFLLVIAGLVLTSILQPMAKISSTFNSGLAFKADRPTRGQEAAAGKVRRPGSMSIVAVARSLALERPDRSPAEDQQYATFLEYVQGGSTSVALGWPGIFMVPITSSTVAGLFFDFILKFPLFVSLFLAARRHVHSDALPGM